MIGAKPPRGSLDQLGRGARSGERPLLGVGDRAEQRAPAAEVLVLREQVQGQEEAPSAAALPLGRQPQRAQLEAHRMEGEGEQVQGQQRVGQAVLAVAEVVLDVAALVLEDVEGLILDLPAGAAAGDDLRDIVRAGPDGGDEAVDGGRFSGAGVFDLQLRIVDLQRIAAARQRQLAAAPQVMELLVRAAARGPLLDGPARPVHAGEILEQGLVVVGLDAEDEVGAGLKHQAAHRLLGVQVVAQADRAESRVARRVAAQPAVAGLGLAVLLPVAVLRRDELRAKRQRVGVAGPDQCGRQHAVIVFGVLAVLALVPEPRLAVLAVDLARVVELGAVERDQGAPAQRLIGLKRLIFCHYAERDVEPRVDLGRLDPVQLEADVVVGGQPADAEQRAGRVAAPGPFEHPLVLQERRRLHEEHRERGHQDVLEAQLRVAPGARVPDRLEKTAQRADQAVDQQPLPHRPGSCDSAAIISASTARRSACGILA